MAGIKILRKWQAGLEAVPGTGVVATRKFAALGSIEKKQPGFYPDLDVESLDRRRDRFALLIEAGGKCEFPWSFEDGPWWMQLGAKGGVAGVQIGATTAYRYTHTPTTNADDRKTATFEWGDDFQAWQCPFGKVNKLNIKGTPASALMASVDFFAKDRIPQAFTAALGDRQIETVLGRTSTLYIDEPGGAIGTTAVAGRLLGYEHELVIEDDRLYTMDNADAGKIADLPAGARKGMTKFLFRFNNRAEYDKWAANIQRLIAVKFNGTDAGAGNLREYKHYAPGWYEDTKIAEQGNSVTIEMVLNQAYSTTLGYQTKYEHVNALAALP
jgi:hypothetical protein